MNSSSYTFTPHHLDLGNCFTFSLSKTSKYLCNSRGTILGSVQVSSFFAFSFWASLVEKEVHGARSSWAFLSSKVNLCMLGSGISSSIIRCWVWFKDSSGSGYSCILVWVWGESGCWHILADWGLSSTLSSYNFLYSAPLIIKLTGMGIPTFNHGGDSLESISFQGVLVSNLLWSIWWVQSHQLFWIIRLRSEIILCIHWLFLFV